MIRVDAYRCSHCGKLFLTERGCVKHEEKYCNKRLAISLLAIRASGTKKRGKPQLLQLQGFLRWQDMNMNMKRRFV